MALPLQRGLQAAAVIAAMALAHVVDGALSAEDDISAPFLREGVRGEPVVLEYGELEVLDVDAAQYLSHLRESVQASGRFLMVEVAGSGADDQLVTGTVRLQDEDGRTYATSAKAGCPRTLTFDAGLTGYGWLCFDVPPSRIDELDLVVGRGSDITDGTRRDEVAVVDLDLDGARAAELARTTAAYVAPQPGLVRQELDPVELEVAQP
ncbi:hypothetical protein [Nocardioides sp. SYSU D00038]|uniref:hypothetical protein n=1 Tax=Nocardioides sp. SYSU D00038 TaxID=2812554 RepID=UPI001967A017|nr:hypothetical protein [Nocardioides sp. SYSU D00038]